MAKTFDATLKGMLEESPGDWLVLAGLPPAEAVVIDADISTFTGAADKVLRISGSPDWIMHLEFQAGPDASLPRRMQTANVLLDDRHDLMVRSIAVLLRPEAHRSNLTGLYERHFEGAEAHLTFRYQIIRVWELPVEPLLAGGVGLLPLAAISAATDAEMPGVVKRMQERLRQPALQPEAPRVWTATFILLGLRYPKTIAEGLLQGVMTMEESTTYQAIISKGREMGRLEEARRNLFGLGSDKFGPPDASTATAIDAIGEIERLEHLQRRVLHTFNWHELLEAPPSSPRTRRRKPKS